MHVCWVDFGGQDEYNVTHQLFLGGDRTLFILAVSMAEEISFDKIDKWIRLVSVKAPDAVIRLVATKIDRCSDLDQRRKHFFNYVHLAVSNWEEERTRRMKSIHVQKRGVLDVLTPLSSIPVFKSHLRLPMDVTVAC
jgi:GTPase SAR1 family protein